MPKKHKRMRNPGNNFPEPTFYSAIPSGFLFLQVIRGRPALKSSKLQLSSRRVALNLTQNTFPLCRKKIPPILFVGATRPKSSKLQLSLRRVAPNHTQNTFLLCRKKIPLYFCRGDPPPSLLNSNLLKAGRPEPHAKYFPAVP